MNKSKIGNNTKISGKYKNIGELKKQSKLSCVQTITRMKNGPIKTYLLKWAFEKFYLQNKLGGNLTTRIKNINNNLCYRHIISHCFDDIDPLISCKTLSILNDNCKNVIESLYNINSSATGIFIDYLIRRIISEIKKKEFIDNRAERFTNINEISYINDNLWIFRKIPNNEINFWNISYKPDIKSKNINILNDKDKFLEIERKNEWLKIKFKNQIGWVRYLVPNVEKTKGISGNIKDYIPNKWFHKIKKGDDNHYCNLGCKNKTEQTMWRTLPITQNICWFQCCQNISYMKVKNTKKYKTTKILKDIFIVSCCHTEAFGSCISQNNFNEIINILNKIDKIRFITHITELCKKLIKNSNNILLNPGLGSACTPIPSDCDLVINDTLIDIKCTKKNNVIYEILQLLGYCALLKYNKTYNLRINNICILNILKCECTLYNIQNITNNNLLEYLNLLINKYNSNKEIIIKTYENKYNYPLFINSFKLLKKINIKLITSKYNWFNKTGFDLSNYGIFNYNINKNQYEKELKKNSLIRALKNAGLNNKKLNKIKNITFDKDKLSYQINLLCDNLNIHISIKKNKNIKHYGNKKCKEIKIGIIDNHYFLREKVNFTMYALKNYFELMERYNNLEIIKYMYSKKGCINVDRKTDSFNVIKYITKNNNKYLTSIQ